jgi:hypothetical protein
MIRRSIAAGADPQNLPATWSPTVFSRAHGKRRRLRKGQPYRTLITTIYGGTSEIMKTIIAREVTGLRT